MRIGLDAGHGGLKNGVYQTAGKRSLHPVDGEVFYEGVNNRLYAKKYATVLTNLGHEVVYIVDPTDPTDVPLSTRVTIANAKDLDLLVSIHSNAAGTPSARGYEVFTAPNASATSKKAADLWITEMQRSFPTLKNRGHKTANFTMIARPKCPSILLELEFHSNDEAVRLLRSWEFSLQTALVLSRVVKLLKK
jgi:N-acetylmuramoyl-L-alanine amidase